MVITPSCSLRNAQTSPAPLGPMAFREFQKSTVEQGLGCLRRLTVFQSLCLPGWTVLYQKHSKDTEETSVLLSYYISINETSSIIFQFAATLKHFDVNILVLPNIQRKHTHTNTHTYIYIYIYKYKHTLTSCLQLVASSGNIQLFLSTLHWQMVYNVSLFFSSLGNAEQTVGFPCNCFKESRLTIGDLASLSVSDPKRSRSLLLNGVFFVKFVFSFGFYLFCFCYCCFCAPIG